MSKRDRRDSDGRDRDRRDYDRRESQPEDEQQRRTGEGEAQEGDSLTALKAILSKVAAQLRPLNLSADESIRLVEQLYGSVLDMDLALAGEADDTRKSSTLAYIQRTTIRRDGDKLVVEFPTPDELRATEPATAGASAAEPDEARAGRVAGQPALGEAGATEPRPREEGARQTPRGGRQREAPGEGRVPPQRPRVEPAERGPAGRPEPEGPEA
jgi:hypothetical protein